MDEFVDPQLFSGMLQGISTILGESLRSGSIRDIALDRAALILKRSEDNPVVCVLVTSKFSKVLQTALHSFAQDFFTEFAPYFSNPSKIGQFAPAERLITERFSFVPEYE